MEWRNRGSGVDICFTSTEYSLIFLWSLFPPRRLDAGTNLQVCTVFFTTAYTTPVPTEGWARERRHNTCENESLDTLLHGLRVVTVRQLVGWDMASNYLVSSREWFLISQFRYRLGDTWKITGFGEDAMHLGSGDRPVGNRDVLLKPLTGLDTNAASAVHWDRERVWIAAKNKLICALDHMHKYHAYTNIIPEM